MLPRAERQDVQANNTPQDDDVKVEDVRYAEREAEDYAEHAGPGDGCVSFRSEGEMGSRSPAHTIVRIYLQETRSAAVHKSTPSMALSARESKLTEIP